MNESESADQKDRLEDVLGVLAHIRLRPGMWIGATDAVAVRAFTTGFSLAADLLGNALAKGEHVIWNERGWETGRPVDAIHQMQEKGWSENEIILETILMMMLNIKRQYDLTGNKVMEAHNRIRQNITENGRQVSDELAQQMESLEKDLGITRNH